MNSVDHLVPQSFLGGGRVGIFNALCDLLFCSVKYMREEVVTEIQNRSDDFISHLQWQNYENV